jgi:peptidoglycan/xylan/chitin deacetylase (PgdA/CDA1 family)
MVSFSFDDFPRSAGHSGAQILEEFGVRGTYFVCGGREGRNIEGQDHFAADDLIALRRAGHEIGCHTFGHIRVPLSSRKEVGDDLARNREYVHRVLGDYPMTSFAYPYGQVTVGAKAFLSRHYPVCRGIWSGVNSGRIDFRQLRATPLERSSFDPTRVSAIIDKAAASNGWLIFFTHDISANPSAFGITGSEFRRVVSEVVERGIDILPMNEAAAKVATMPCSAKTFQ